MMMKNVLALVALAIVEILGIEEWEDFQEGWITLGPYFQGLKIQYQLYPGQMFDLDILIWPHAAKIWCGAQYCWVRACQFLERRWLIFSIRHCFPVRVVEFRSHVATISPSIGTGAFGASAKNDKNVNEVLFPPLRFREHRHFAPVIESEVSLEKFMIDLIWSAVVKYIPASFLDGDFDIPHCVTGCLLRYPHEEMKRLRQIQQEIEGFCSIRTLFTPLHKVFITIISDVFQDVRHQGTALDHIREKALERTYSQDVSEEVMEEITARGLKDSKKSKDNVKKKPEPVAKEKFEIRLEGDCIIAGTGRLVPFRTVGERPPDLGEIIVLIGSNNLPAQDDWPVVFVNVDSLCDVPVNEFRALRITHLYTRWLIGDEEHVSQMQPVKSKKVSFNDHHCVPMPYEAVSKIMDGFCDNDYEIQLRGTRLPLHPPEPVLFGYKNTDREYDKTIIKPTNTNLDFVIAVTKIHASRLAKSLNSLVRGEFCLYPPTAIVRTPDREGVCTNDINGIKFPVEPQLVVQPDLILLAQMTLEVSLGIVGCKSRQQCPCYSRMYGLFVNSEAIMTTLRYITSINDDIAETEKREDLLTGFAIDTGNTAVLYVEGPKDGNILLVWDIMEDFYPTVKPVFASTARYCSRMYPELLNAATPFCVLKMFVPIGVLLACPPVYARPALPLPTRTAVLKLGRLMSHKQQYMPARCEMPTGTELKSFRLELCVAPRPIPVSIVDNTANKTEQYDQEHTRPSIHSVSRVIWDT